MLGHESSLPMSDLLGALDTRLDDVEVADTQAIEMGRHVAECCGRMAVRHRSVLATRRDAHAHPIGTTGGDGGRRHLEQAAGAVFDRTAGFVGTLARPVL